jgi:EmrB/QacA subfamily drug resistance transporter
MKYTDRSVQSTTFRNNPWIAVAVILFAPTLIVIDIFIVNVALPTIKGFYQATDAFVQLIVASYLIGFTIFIITGSRAGDRYGRKRVYIWGVIAFTITSALCGWAHSVQQLVVFRFFQGIAAAFTMPQALTLLHLTFHEGKQRDKAYGLYGITAGLAAIAGQLLGGYFISAHLIHDSWRLIFLVNIPVGVIAVFLAWLFLKESKEDSGKRFDITGVIWLTLALAGLIYPITRGRELGFPAWSVAMIVGSLILFWLFFKDQKLKTERGLAPLINMQLFAIKNFNIGLLCVIFFFGVHTAFLLNCALFFQNGYGFSAAVSSYFFSIFGLGFILASIWSIKNASKYGVRMLQFGCLIMIFSFIMQSVTFGHHTPSYGSIIFLLFIYGIGNGLVLPSVLNISLKGIRSQLAGTASGVYSTVQQLSSALGVSVIGGVFLTLLQHISDYHLAYRISLICMMVYLLIVIILLQKLRASNPKTESPQPVGQAEMF